MGMGVLSQGREVEWAAAAMHAGLSMLVTVRGVVKGIFAFFFGVEGRINRHRMNHPFYDQAPVVRPGHSPF
jgi:hypothetical protein